MDLLVMISTGKAQIANIEDFTIYNQNSYKIDRSVTGLYQDRLGFIWFSGSENIYRFDGLNFVSVLDLKDKDFVFPQINAGRNDILQDHKDRYWFLTHTDMVRWDPSQPSPVAWKKFSHNDRDSIPLPTSRMHRIVMDSKGFIWVVFDGADLYKIDPDSGKAIQRIDFRIQEPGLRRSQIDAMEYNSKDNRIYFGADYIRIIAINPDNGKIEYPHLPLRSLLKKAGIYESLSKYAITDFVKDETDWWLSLSNNTILRYSFKTGSFVVLGQYANNNKMVVSRIKKGPSAQIWHADVSSGLQIIDAKTNLMTPLSQKAGGRNNELGNVLDIYFDHNNVVWLATSRCLAKYDPQEHLFKEYSPYQETQGAITHIYYQDNLENEFIGTNRGLLLKLKNERTFSIIPFPSNQKTAIDIISICYLYDDHYILGTTNGLYQFTMDSRQIKKVEVKGDPESVSQYFENPAHSIVLDTIDQEPVIWLASKLRFLYLYKQKEKTIKVILPNELDSTAYPHQVIQNLLKTREGTIWLTTSGGGFCKMIEKRKPTFKTWQHIEGDANSIQNNVLTDCAISGNGNIWLSSITGIDVFDQQRFYHLTNSNGKIGTISNMIKGNSQDIWSVSGNELIRWSQDGKLLNIYPKGRVNFNSIFIKHNSDVILWESKFDQFTDFTSNKIYVLEHRDENTLSEKPNTIITHVMVGPSDSSHMIYRTHNHLKYSQNSLTFSFASMSFTHSQLNQFMWRLVGVDKDWIKPGNNTSKIIYSGLQPGDYTFLVKACNAYGIWDSKGATLTFTILPPWFQTLWFRLLAIIFLSSMIIFIFQLRTRRLLAIQKLEIEKSLAIDAERKRIARDMHDDLGSGLSALHLYSEYLKNSSPSDNSSLASGLEKIVNSSRDLIQKVKEIIWANESHESSAITLIKFVNSYIRELSGINNVTIIIDEIPISDNITLTQDEHKNIYLCIKESINNARKYADASEINVNIFTEQNYRMVIKISDNGHGFEKENVGNFRGNGLRNMAARMHEIGGSFDINSDHRGTTIQLKL